MAKVTFCGVSYTCATAIKGSDYVRLVDSAGKLVASFEGISDFSGFAISSGSWVTPEEDVDCNVAVMGSDGLPRPSNYCPKHFLAGGQPFTGSMILSNGVQYGSSLPSTGVEGQIFFKLN